MALLAACMLAATPRAGAVGADADEVKAVRDKAIAFLKKQQGADGSFSPKIAGPGVTALVAAALLRNGLTADDPIVAKALDYIARSARKDGGIYSKGLANYTTCVALMALKEANKDGKYDTVIKNAGAFLKKLQQSDVAEKNVTFGGVGYGNKGRPDMSNTQYFIEALIAAGVPKSDPAIQRALKFISRCQNYDDKEKGNDQPFAKKARAEDKGGFTYVPIDSDDNPHATGDGGLRSLGAMTYAGLKSFLYAGVSRDDPRVKGAIAWIRRNYTLDENPGMKQAGLFYYYHTFAKAMDAIGEDEFADARGTKHDWRKELLAALKKRQTQGGGFINKGDKAFGEQDANLATAFALLSLSYVQKK
jgi:squalene-hopene/tetraprenyl-beta-curcumene cyclase